MKDRKGNEMKAGDRAFVPVVIVRTYPIGDDGRDWGCHAVIERPDGSPGPLSVYRTSYDIEKATPLSLAAGDLLAALKGLLDAMGVVVSNPGIHAAIEAAHAAVARAEGRLP